MEEWAGEFENRELKELLELIIGSYREHSRLDHGLLVQQATGETQRQHLCALTLEEDESYGPAEWRRDLKVRKLRKTRAMLKARLEKASGENDLVSLQIQWQEVDQQLRALSAL